jgi:uncharacterized phage-like protein YoqJ
MSNNEMLNEAIYKALADGVAKLIKNGLAFTVMLGTIGGLSWGIAWQHAQFEADWSEVKFEIRELKQEHSAQLNDYRRLEYELRKEISECNEKRIEQAQQIARLEAIMKRR